MGKQSEVEGKNVAAPVTEASRGPEGITRRSALQLVAGVVCASGLAMAQPDPKPQPQSDANEKELSRWLVPQDWVKQRTKPVISLGKPGDFDDMHIFAPCVAKENGRYYLWYSGSRGTVAERVFRLGLATSDDAVEFTKVSGNPVYEFGDGNTSVSTASVLRETDGTLIRENGKLRMWFSGQQLNKRGESLYFTRFVELLLTIGASTPSLCSKIATRQPFSRMGTFIVCGLPTSPSGPGKFVTPRAATECNGTSPKNRPWS